MNVRDALLDAEWPPYIYVPCYEIIFMPLFTSSLSLSSTVRWADLILNSTPTTILITLKFFFSYHDPSIIYISQNPVLLLPCECV